MHQITLTVSKNVLMNEIIQMNNNFIACVQSFCYQQCTHNLKRSLHWSIAALITFCSKSNQVCIRQFFRAINVTNLCFVHALLHNTPNFIIYRSILMNHIRYILIQFSLVISHCNITFSIFHNFGFHKVA